ncbi:MAG: helix-turn-helix domain-containing protein [Pseudomonadota bacterium]
MRVFWLNGYSATSMADLVEATGSTRQSIYGDFGSKHGLYVACFDTYREAVVAPALDPFCKAQHRVAAIADYFDIQIAHAERIGLPGPGCLVGNATTELAAHDPAIGALVQQHHRRLEDAFASALPASLSTTRRCKLARFLVLAAQGLWAVSRVTASAEQLRAQAATIISMLKKEIENDA